MILILHMLFKGDYLLFMEFMPVKSFMQIFRRRPSINTSVIFIAIFIHNYRQFLFWTLWYVWAKVRRWQSVLSVPTQFFTAYRQSSDSLHKFSNCTDEKPSWEEFGTHEEIGSANNHTTRHKHYTTSHYCPLPTQHDL